MGKGIRDSLVDTSSQEAAIYNSEVEQPNQLWWEHWSYLSPPPRQDESQDFGGPEGRKTMRAKLLLIALAMMLCLPAFAGRQAVLLVSVTGKSGILFQRKETSLRLVEQFTKHYREFQLPLKVIREATQDDLHRELSDPRNDAVFWISHAVSSDSQDGLGFDDGILDFEGRNVRELFQNVHPSVRFLAVLGCKARPILEKLVAEGFYKHNGQLTIYSRDEKIDGLKEIPRALESYRKVTAEPSSFCPVKEGYPVRLVRQLVTAGKPTSVKVLNRGRLLGVFPKGEPGASQEMNVYLESVSSPQDLKLVFDSGLAAKSEIHSMGLIEVFTFSFDGGWEPFTDSHGRILGHNQNIYRYSGSATPLMPPASYRPFVCR
jgi:hypothetical protein